MNFDLRWEIIHASRTWGQWPDIDFVRFAMRKFGRADRIQCRFLELGCGQGAQMRFLLEEGFVAYGMDASSSAIDKMRAYLRPKMIGSAGIVLSEVCDLAGHSDMLDGDRADPLLFDCILDVCTLQHCGSVEDIAAIVKMYAARLKPRGWFFSKIARQPYKFDHLGDVPNPLTVNVPDLADIFRPSFQSDRWNYGSIEEWRNYPNEVVSHYIIHAQNRD